MAKQLTVERALENLRVLVRQRAPDPAPPTVWSGAVPDDLGTEDFKTLYLFPEERRAWEQLQALLADDLRFEYMSQREIKDATWRFLCESHLRKGRAVVDAFVAKHAREPRDHQCFFPVHLLTISKPVEIQGVTLLPMAEAPTIERMRPLPTDEPGSVIQVPCRGTSYEAMTARARAIAEHALRILRATLREDRFTAEEQLRFRLGHAVWFDDGAGGWTKRPDQGWELELDDQLLSEARKAALFDLPMNGGNEVERRAKLALTWFEQGQLAADPLLRLLFLFTALEAILGDKAGGLKGPHLALRRALLGLATRDGFTHPARILVFYDKVRSFAVHGEEAPLVPERELNAFAWDVRRALNEFLEFARRESLTKRKQVRDALDADPRRENVVAGLLRDQPDLWGPYFDPPSK